MPGAWAGGCGPENLKWGVGPADSGGMFFPRKTPVQLDPERFRALRLSLNAPVVSTEDLPSGPARAAIVLWWEDDQSPVLEVRMRSAKTGGVVAYGFDEPLANAGDVETALEAALTFAESMGFLFDDDVLSGEDTGAREPVIRAWEEFEGVSEVAPVTRPQPREDEPLELTELAPEPAPAQVPLTKFRARATPEPPVSEATEAPARPARRARSRLSRALGRVALVRGKGRPEARRSLLLRILGAF